MDFKSRFQGKTSKITKDGGVDSAVTSNISKPITKVEKITMNAPNVAEQLISYGSTSTGYSK